MNAERLLELYERIADAPEAIARLRRFILDLAVRGKLVPQTKKDEPASELLKRIAKEKARSAKATRGRQSEGRGRTEPFEFSLPVGWALSTLGDIALKITDGTHQTPNYVGSGVPFLSVKDFSGGKLSLSNTRFITEEEHNQLYTRCDPKRGDILIGRIGTLGRAVLVDTDQAFSLFVSVGLIRFSHKELVPEYFRMLLNSPLVEGEFDRIKIGGGTHTNKLNLGDLQTVALPLPPLAEQHRIVSKVDELMALCNRLEAARAEREATRDRLAAASLARLNAPDPDTSVFADHARFALDNLTALATRPDQIKQIRQTILNLAVRGKLVPQDEKDQPASELLKQIAKQKALSTKPKGMGVEAEMLAGNGFDAAFELPDGWRWVRLDQITEIGTGLTPSKAQTAYYDGGTIPWINSSATSNDVIDKAKFYVTPLAVQACRLKIYPAGSLIVALYGQGKTRGQVAELGIDAAVNQACAVVQWLSAFDGLKGFVRLSLDQQYEAMRERAEGGAQPNLNVGKIKERNFPLPPLAEQHRIVKKVDALMALCDQLEASLTATENTRRRLLQALLAEALAPAAAREMEAAQ